MQPLSDDIAEWCDETWGQNPLEVLEWFEDDEMVQVFIKLPRSVLVADFLFKENAMNMKRDRIEIRHHLHIPLDIWNPGSIQANRTRDSRVRFRHRHAEIVLSARFRAPEWGQALLEEWLMAQRGEEIRPKSSEQRLATIRRSKSSIERYLEQSNLEYAKEMLAVTQKSLSNAARELARHRRVAESEE